jgi:two-component system chemotaxis response regulator CheB
MAQPEPHVAEAAVFHDDGAAVDLPPLQRDVVVIGASAGGVEALETLVRHLPPELPAAIFVVLHVLPTGTSVLHKLLARAGDLPATHARNGEVFERGHIYVAPPDHHLLIQAGAVRLTRGPRENGHRPAVDTMFRSAARAYGRGVIGAVLSGSLDDGTAGLRMILARGGTTIAQDPADALYDGMPRSAVAHDAAQHVVPIREMGDLLCRLIDEPLERRHLERPDAPPEEENEPLIPLSLERAHDEDRADAASGLTCPECGGALWERLENGVVRFACHVGHVYSPANLEVEQSRALETALWSALRSLEERADLYRRMGRRSGSSTGQRMANRVSEIEDHARVLSEAIMAIGREPHVGDTEVGTTQ